MSSRVDFTRILGATVLLGTCFLAEARGHAPDVSAHGSKMPASSHGTAVPSSPDAVTTELPSYFGSSADARLIYAHITFMILAWIVVLPLGLALSIARSSLVLAAHGTFAVTNALGLLTGRMYNNMTPDLYPNNVHHKLGWWITGIFCAQAAMGLVGLLSDSLKHGGDDEEEHGSFMSVSADALARHQRLHSTRTECHSRFSGDSGQGTESASTSSRSQPASSPEEGFDRTLGDRSGLEDRLDDGEIETLLEDAKRVKLGSFSERVWGHYLSRSIPAELSRRLRRVGEPMYDIIDRLLLPIGFVVMATGVVTYGGIFQGRSIYNGLAHFVKGGIFFWYGLLTLGRWMGCFADFGWAWNIRPPTSLVGSRKASVPSAEFVESFVIFLYGSTNVFLEHLAAWGEAWTTQDLEHVSISVMFFGGGLCGMLVESTRLRYLLNTPITNATSLYRPSSSSSPWHHSADDDHPSSLSWHPPKTYRFSINPLPGLTILLLGLMMSSHHQSSIVSTMMHKQWGYLLVGFALSRAFTYLLIYLSPPTSLLPSRPPSELISAFCLVSGGLVFMASNRDTIEALESYHLQPIVIFALTLGLTGLVMAWTILVVAVKGWGMGNGKNGKGNGL